MYVCKNCFENKCIQKYIHENGKIGKCSFCSKEFGRYNRKVMWAEDMKSYLLQCLSPVYDEPHIDFIPRDPETRKLLSEGETLYDILCEEGAGVSDSLYEYFSVPYLANIYSYSSSTWDYFMETFNRDDNSVEEVKEITKSWLRYFLENIKVKKLNRGVSLFRIRKKDEVGTSDAKSLGSSPCDTPYNEKNRYGNGFYSSLNLKTCFKEVGDKSQYYVGRWISTKDIVLYDLTEFEELKDLFQEGVSFKWEGNKVTKAILDILNSPKENKVYLHANHFINHLYEATQKAFSKQQKGMNNDSFIFDISEDTWIEMIANKAHGIIYSSTKDEEEPNILLFGLSHECLDNNGPAERRKDHKTHLILKEYWIQEGV